jgi:hypothetical protein
MGASTFVGPVSARTLANRSAVNVLQLKILRIGI